ncbi:hypothetical protein FPRO04_13207 [Fusarium proliferatum]|nr:hypothetical protein FPRO04_13207 [Fusarium proliferatum]
MKSPQWSPTRARPAALMLVRCQIAGGLQHLFPLGTTELGSRGLKGERETLSHFRETTSTHRQAREKHSSGGEAPSWEGGKSLWFRWGFAGGLMEGVRLMMLRSAIGQARGRRNRDEKGLDRGYMDGDSVSMIAEHCKASQLVSPRLGSSSSSSSSRAIPAQAKNVSGWSLHTRRSKLHAQAT